MELKTFIAETISQIVQGVAEAQGRCSDFGARVNPPLLAEGADTMTPHGLFWSANRSAIQLVQFDVAVDATEGTGTKGGIGVVVSAFMLGGTGHTRKETSASNRVKFVVPLLLPKAPQAKAQHGE